MPSVQRLRNGSTVMRITVFACWGRRLKPQWIQDRKLQVDHFDDKILFHRHTGGLMHLVLAIVLLAFAACNAKAETPEEWILLGSRVHGGFGSFIPLGIKIGLDAVERLKAQPRELSVTYYDSDKSPCACFADGIAISTYASPGQRTLTIAQDKAPDGAIAVAVIRPRKG